MRFNGQVIELRYKQSDRSSNYFWKSESDLLIASENQFIIHDLHKFFCEVSEVLNFTTLTQKREYLMQQGCVPLQSGKHCIA